jgi:hypothetical protein
MLIGMGEMRRAIAREQEERQTQNRFASTLVIPASIIFDVLLDSTSNLGVGKLASSTRLERATRRIFAPEVIHYIDFILKARSVGLTLAEMKRVVMLAQDGTNACLEIVQAARLDRSASDSGRGLRLIAAPF